MIFEWDENKNQINLHGMEVMAMRDEYDIENLNPRRNPCSNRQKKQITINIDSSTIDYFKGESEASGIPYQTLMNLYLTDCAANGRKLRMSWE